MSHPSHQELLAGRAFLKSDHWDEWRAGTSDQKAGVPHPPLSRPASG